ncbi:MAG TPA: nuclear transport factor 2 family protein [Croceibacterium sp.]
MSDDLSNGARVRAAYEHWAGSLGSDAEPFFALVTDDFVMASVLEPPELHEMACDHCGPAHLREYFAALEADWEMVEFPTERVVEQGDTVVWIGRCTWRNRHTGLVETTPKVDVWTFRGDRAVHLLEMFDTLAFVRGAGMLPQLAAAVA